MPTTTPQPEPGFGELEFFVIRHSPTRRVLIVKCEIRDKDDNICPFWREVGGSEGAILRHVAVEASEHYQTHVAALQKRMDEINAALDARPQA